MQTDANYWKLKIEKDFLSVEHNKLQKDYKNMEQTFLKQQKELEELKEDIGNEYQSKNEIQMQFDQRQAKMDRKPIEVARQHILGFQPVNTTFFLKNYNYNYKFMLMIAWL